MSSAEIETTSDDAKHLDMLAIFYYVFAGMAALGACFGLIYVVLGAVFILNPPAMPENGDMPPEVLGWIFFGVGTVVLLLGWSFAFSVYLAGRSLHNRLRHTYCLIIAALCCLQVPLGTILGVFTFVVLMRPSVKAIFEGRQPAELI